MDPKTLVDTSMAVGLPAPVWFIELFKWLGFTLHEVPMNLWFAGLLVALHLRVMRNEQGRRFGARLVAQMPVIIAMGINFGIVPLLFIQVGFAPIFYPATILMAWFWFAIICLLIPAYYGVYLYAYGLADHAVPMPRWKRAAGWLAALLFITIGFIFANALSLMENMKAWPDLWQQHNFHGAALGTALNVADPRMWCRWLMMFGLALTTTAAWVVFDAVWFGRRESERYRAWAKHFAWKLYVLGTLWFAVAGSCYTFGAWTSATRETMFHNPWIALTAVTAVAPGVVLVLLWLAGQRAGDVSRPYASLVGLAQFGVLGINAASRQVVQHVEIARYFDLLKQSTDTQWAPLLIFLVVFVIGLGIVAWMIYQVAKLPAGPQRH